MALQPELHYYSVIAGDRRRMFSRLVSSEFLCNVTVPFTCTCVIVYGPERGFFSLHINSLYSMYTDSPIL